MQFSTAFYAINFDFGRFMVYSDGKCFGAFHKEFKAAFSPAKREKINELITILYFQPYRNRFYYIGSKNEGAASNLRALNYAEITKNCGYLLLKYF